MARVSAIAAIGRRTRAIGKNDALLWRFKDDLKRFKELTMGHPVIMGRKTFVSVVSSLGKPLPGRENIVVTRDGDFSYPGIAIAHSIEEAIAKAKELDRDEVFIGGGGQIYAKALPMTDRLYLTLVDDDSEGDAYFPLYADEFTTELAKEERTDEVTGLSYAWIDLERA